MTLSNHKWATLTFLKKVKPTNLILSLFIFLAAENVFAAKYCLKNSSPQTKSAVENKLRPFLKKGEVIDWELNCFELQISEGRDILIQKLIGEVAPFEVGSEVIVARAPCELELIEVTESKENGSKVGLARNVTLSDSTRAFNSETRSRLLLSSGRPGRIEAYETMLDLVCLSNSSHSAEVEVWLYANGGRAQISTTLNLTKGSQQFLGDIVKELEDKNRTVSLGNGYQRRKKKESRKTQFYLLLK